MSHIKLFEHFNEEDKWLDLWKELTAKTTPAGFEINVEPIILRYGFQKDENGNYFKLNPKSKVLFTAHADNYCSKEEEVTHVVDYGKLETDGTTILGGDNKVDFDSYFHFMRFYLLKICFCSPCFMCRSCVLWFTG